MKKLSGGMYINGNSVIHRLDSTVKIILFFILVAAVAVANSIIGYCTISVFTAVVVILSKTGFRAAFGNITGLIWFFTAVFLMNFLFFSAEKPWISFWIFNPSYAGLLQGIKVVLRVIVFLILSNILNSTTAPMELTGAIENLMYPLSFIKVPVGQIALIISVAIQFIPTLSEEAQLIKKVQTARGAGFDSRKLFDKARAVLPMVVPVFISAFRRADELSLAMEARGCRADLNKRKKIKIHIGFSEAISFFICTILCAVQIFIF